MRTVLVEPYGAYGGERIKLLTVGVVLTEFKNLERPKMEEHIPKCDLSCKTPLFDEIFF